MEIKGLKKYLVPTLVVFIVISIIDYIFHGIIMEKIYLANGHLFRPMDEIQKHKHYLWFSNLIFSGAFCYIYSKGIEKKNSIEQGIRYAIWITLLIWVPCTLATYVICPYPKSLVFAWLVGYTIETLIAGITVALTFPKK